jgi:hypothetical protein
MDSVGLRSAIPESTGLLELRYIIGSNWNERPTIIESIEVI